MHMQQESAKSGSVINLAAAKTGPGAGVNHQAGKEEGSTVELKDAINQFHHGEKLKSYLIAASGLIAEMGAFPKEEAWTAIRLCKSYLDQVRGEMRLAACMGGIPKLPEAETKVREALWEVHINRPEEAHRLLGEAISLVVSGTEQATKYLIDQSLL